MHVPPDMRLILLFILLCVYCIPMHAQTNTIKITGSAQGTTYHITYLAANGLSYKREIDSVLADIDSSLSTYVPVSIISRINQNDSTVIVDHYFSEVFEKAMEVSRKTGGKFDVTVAPIINAYGFGFTKRSKMDSAMIDSLLKFVSYKKVALHGNKIIKTQAEVMLDFNAIAQGYSVDVLAGYLWSKGINNYVVELGGEVLAKGRNENNINWKIGIDQPSEKAGTRSLQAIISLTDRALATSGNYSKFYIEDGKKYSHIIDPHTGYPAKHNLLSATVIAQDCMTADAYATAFMVMGLEKTKKFLSNNKKLKLEVYLVYDDKGDFKTFTSRGLKKWIM